MVESVEQPQTSSQDTSNDDLGASLLYKLRDYMSLSRGVVYIKSCISIVEEAIYLS